jgi:uncharacterized membrane protein
MAGDDMLVFYPTTVTAPVRANRYVAFDRLRGLIMVLMAIDHASFYIARTHASEDWGRLPPFYASHAGSTVALAFVTRWITHLCAPGFFMLMGAGMVWLGKARQKDGWSHARIRKFFITRGLILLVINQFVENPAWLLGILSAGGPQSGPPDLPGGGSAAFVVMAVISALGLVMIFWSFLIEAPSLVILAVSAVAMAASVRMTPPVTEAATLFPVWQRLLFVPGHTNFIEVVYSFVPWLVPAGLGIVLARVVVRKPPMLLPVAAAGGAALLVAFVAMRSAIVGDPHAPLQGIIGFLTVTKYPPSPAFFSVTLGLDLLLLAFFTLTVAARWLSPLEVYGRSPLFFYLLHLYVFGVLSFAFRTGASFPVMYAVWAAAVAAMYPLVKSYGRFKASKPVDSAWRLL